MEEIKQKTEAELAQEAIERKIIEERRAARRRKEAREAKMKLLLEVLFLLVVMVGSALYQMHKMATRSKIKLEQDTLLNATTQQVSQIIDNIRQAYAIYSEEKEISMERLIELGAIPESIVDEKEAFNLYDGNIIIEPSRPLENIKEAVESPTFKMVYRGLPHDVCVNLAILNWGDKVEGLMAVAIGEYDGEKDTAMDEIDKIYQDEKPVEFIDKFGRVRTIQPRKHYQLNVAKPGDSFIPTPFTKDNAEGGCSCSRTSPTCSVAWRYAIYAVDKPNRIESEIEKMERLMKERLEQRVKEQEAEQQRLREEEMRKRATEAMKQELEAQQQTAQPQAAQ